MGKDAVVKGEVSAREVAIAGTLVGTIRCAKKLEVFASAKIVGTIQAPVIKMESGAQVNARIIMSRKIEDVELISHSQQDAYSYVVKPHH